MCAVTHYISDWKAAQNGTISVKAVGPVKDENLTMISKHNDFMELTQAKYCPVEIPGMLKQATTKAFGPCTCLSMFLPIKAPPVHAEKVAAADVNSDSDSDDSLLKDFSHKFTKVTVKGKTKIKKQLPKSAVAPTLEHDGPVLTPAQQRRAKEAERKRKMDLENNVPSPLFIMVLPGEMEGTYLFISRLKYAALATNVLNGLVPFFTHHLGELTTTQANRVITKWLSISLIHTTRRKELVWCLETLRARPLDQTLQGIDEAIDFLDGFGSDPLDVAKAKLEFDMEMADAKDIDDGATVAGAMDELLEKDSQLEAAITETGFIPDNWRHLMNFAIEKKPGDFRLTEMRTIQLMNSESQANYKKLGRLAMAYGEEYHLLANGQCGSRKHHQAIDLALSKRLVWDLLILQRFCFVDDTDVIKAGKSVEQSGEDICYSVQQAASTWAGGISATGGAINPETSFWWLIDFVWDSREGKWRFRRTHQLLSDHPLQIPGLTGELEALRRLEPDEAEKTLGVMLAPLEDQHAHVAHLKSIAKKWAEQVRSGHLHKYDVIPLIKTTVMKSLEYHMVLTTLDAATWVSIISLVLQVCLPKAGICRSFPCDMVLAPLKFQGLGIPHRFGTQVSKHIEVLLRHLSNQTKTGAYMEAAVQEHQLETGTSFGLFQQDYSNMAILASDTWLKRVWKELEDLDIYVALDSPGLPLRCEGDALHIEVFMELEVDQAALKWLNWCRMFLQVCTVSDIVTADGRSIRESMWHGERDYAHRSSYQWPCTVWPNRNHWKGHGWQHYRHRRSSTRSIQWDYPRFTQLSGCKRPHNEHTDNGVSFLPAPFWTQPLPADLCQATVHITPLLGTLALTGIGTAPRQPHRDSKPSLLAAWMTASARVTEYVGWTPEEIEIDGDESLLAAALLEDRLCLTWSPLSGRHLPALGPLDAWAVAYRHQLEASHLVIAPNARFFTELTALYIGDVKQSRLNPEQVQELVALPALRKRWHEGQMITTAAEVETDWISLARAMSSLPAGVQRWTTKHVMGMCGVGKFKVWWGAADSAACPCCGEFKDHLHVPRCTAPSASVEWERWTASLDQWLDTQVTDPAIKHAILYLLQGVCDPPLPRSRMVPVRLCFVDNTDVIEAGDTVHHSGEDICASVQAAATLWLGGIRATGGAINPEKS
ncbi:unnamed protein product, partial [Cylindrotheca closterium]